MRGASVRRQASLTVALSILVLLLGACGGGAASAPVSSGSASVAASSSLASNAAASAGAATPAISVGEPIKVGLIESLTGPFAEGGTLNRDGFNLYLNASSNTLAGRKIAVVVADDQGKPDVGLTKAKQLVEGDKVQILMGVTPTPVCLAIATYVKDAHVPFVPSANCGASALTTDAKFASPYLARISVPGSEEAEPMGDWASKQYHRAVVMTADFAGGLDFSDAFASAFVKRGGSIVQEAHPALGTTDFGPFLAKLDPSADVVAFFGPGVDADRFAQQYGGYARNPKLPVLDMGGQITKGQNLAELKDKALGMVASDTYYEGSASALIETFTQAFQAQYAGRPVSSEVAQGYASAQILEAAIKKVNGNVDDQQAFLNALYATDVDTIQGHVKLDSYHDVVRPIYIYQVAKQGDRYGEKLLETYPDVSQFWDKTPEQLAKLPYGRLKDKWVGMTKDRLAELYKP